MLVVFFPFVFEPDSPLTPVNESVTSVAYCVLHEPLQSLAALGATWFRAGWVGKVHFADKWAPTSRVSGDGHHTGVSNPKTRLPLPWYRPLASTNAFASGLGLVYEFYIAGLVYTSEGPARPSGVVIHYRHRHRHAWHAIDALREGLGISMASATYKFWSCEHENPQALLPDASPPSFLPTSSPGATDFHSSARKTLIQLDVLVHFTYLPNPPTFLTP